MLEKLLHELGINAPPLSNVGGVEGWTTDEWGGFENSGSRVDRLSFPSSATPPNRSRKSRMEGESRLRIAELTKT